MEKFLAVAVKSVGPGGGTKLFLPPTQPTSPNFLSDAIRKTSTTKTGEKRSDWPLCNFDHDDLDDDNSYEEPEDGDDLGVQGCALPWPPENCIEMWKAEKAQVVSNCNANDVIKLQWLLWNYNDYDKNYN